MTNYSVNCPQCRITLIVPHTILSTGGILACTACGAHFQCAPIGSGGALAKAPIKAAPENQKDTSLATSSSGSRPRTPRKQRGPGSSDTARSADVVVPSRRPDGSHGSDRRSSISSQGSSLNSLGDPAADPSSIYPSIANLGNQRTSSSRQYFAKSDITASSGQTQYQPSQFGHLKSDPLSTTQSASSRQRYFGGGDSQKQYQSDQMGSAYGSRLTSIVEQEAAHFVDRVKAAALEDLKMLAGKGVGDQMRVLEERHQNELRKVEADVRESFKKEVTRLREMLDNERQRANKWEGKCKELEFRLLDHKTKSPQMSDDHERAAEGIWGGGGPSASNTAYTWASAWGGKEFAPAFSPYIQANAYHASSSVRVS